MTEHDTLITLARACYVRQQALEDVTHGAALAVLRGNVFAGMHDEDLDLNAARQAMNEIYALQVADMPAHADLIALLLECIAIRIGGLSRAAAWQSIGIKHNTGRDILAGRSRCDWPIWFTLREAALIDHPLTI